MTKGQLELIIVLLSCIVILKALESDSAVIGIIFILIGFISLSLGVIAFFSL